MPEIQILPADLQNPRHQTGIVELIEMYASEEMGGGKPLSDDVKGRLIPALQQVQNGLHFLAFFGDQPIGVAICFVGFSTFRARPLVNIHDLAVHREFRGQGVGRRLLHAAEEAARQRGCCVLTLEVREDNAIARGLYERVGFRNDSAGASMAFMTKQLGS